MRVLAAVLAGAAVISATTVRAEEKPLWELGAGVGALSLPHYRGSDQSKTYTFPVPYFVYNGERLHVDRRGARGDLAHRGNVWLDISLGLGPPADSEDNNARTDMPDLDPTLEIGPSLRILLLNNGGYDRRLTLYLPLRGVVATDLSHWEAIGAVFAPRLTYDEENFGPGGGWNFSFGSGPVFASEEYHDYYYEVRPKFATAERPAYDARGGYSGLRSTMTLSKRFKEFWIGGFMRYDSLRGAVFEDSPLVRQQSSLMAGIAMSWIFARSEEMVPVRSVEAGLQNGDGQ